MFRELVIDQEELKPCRKCLMLENVCWSKKMQPRVSGWRTPCVPKIPGAGCNLLVRGGGGGK